MVFPHMVLHFDVGRKRSLAALEQALVEDQRVFLVAQHDAGEEDPNGEDLYEVGTISRVKQVLKLPGDNIRVLVEGMQRGRLVRMVQEEPCLLADVAPVRDTARAGEKELAALVRATQSFFEEYAKSSGRVTGETVASVLGVEEPAQLADVIAANVLTDMDDRQHILGLRDVGERLEALCGILARETELTAIERQVQQRVRTQIEKNQKDYFLREQIRAIQTELGDRDANDVEDLRERLAHTPLNDEARQKVERELGRLSRMTPGTPEIGVSRSYIEWILDLPWGKSTQDRLDTRRARRVLDEDHDGLDEVKERIVEYLAVSRLKGSLRGPILCLVGPPGVGKTSVARSVARALGRRFVQMSLGGVRDEAEIRGHRRTYVGAIPGRILYGMKQAGTMNPVFLFDEIDKMSHDFRGDPASAMLEVLDAEQNGAFRDHYLELPFDLSQVLFLTTANYAEEIPAPLLDRMELIRLPGYTQQEKLRIARRHLVPKQLAENGLRRGQVRLPDRTLRAIIGGYTREAGVRQLERTIAKVLRKAALRRLEAGEEADKALTVQPGDLQAMLGPARFRRGAAEKKPEVGLARGLAYTAYGGETLAVETTVMPGTGGLLLTGQLGDVMKESARAAMSYVRARAVEFGLPPDFYKALDVHIHVPEGAVPKDGPSAGVTLATSLVSALTGIPVRQDVAMTGEITLRGRVLPVGGIKEKLLAAHMAGIGNILLPAENRPDLDDVPEEVREHLQIRAVERVDEVLSCALTRRPARWSDTALPKQGNAEVHNGN
ncbi:MAG TPA: endopeptidase La [Candidatus Avichristensenella intestinipullorum]|uniref:Lon protease n=1 Tax=Candidatus Avichristensenella intestinipullorum TaxID=2840693 RepID=A0A9D1CJW9_9FIRM|nr:endopeptidase La [Candidatus Avichristensenella intestinipullorum]